MSSAKRKIFEYMNPPDNTSYDKKRPTVTNMSLLLVKITTESVYVTSRQLAGI
jgi:hypothetical protein